MDKMHYTQNKLGVANMSDLVIKDLEKNLYLVKKVYTFMKI